MLKIDNLSFDYVNKKALDNSSLIAQPKNIIGLFGHNGSGKSTLLNILASALPKHSGEGFFNNEDLFDKNNFIKKHLRAQIGVLLQTPSSDDKLSLRDNLDFFAKLYFNKNYNYYINKTLEEARLEEYAKKPVKTLSLGMKRKFEIYRTFMHNPQLVLLDEPTAGLDFYEQNKINNYIKNYAQNNNTIIIISSHNSEDLELANNIYMLKHGKTILSGSFEDLTANLPKWRVNTNPENILDNNLILDFLNNNIKNYNITNINITKPNLKDAYEQASLS